jgi:hypothetical protein
MALTNDKADGVFCFMSIWALSILANSQRVRCGVNEMRLRGLLDLFLLLAGLVMRGFCR